MKVSSKGQVTIPIEIREEAGIVPGCEMAMKLDNGRIIIEKKSDSSRGKALVELMRGQGKLRMSTEEILDLTRSEV